MKTAIQLFPFWLLVVLLTGCRATPEPGPITLAGPEVGAVTFSYHGTPLAGPIPSKSPDVKKQGALRGTVSLFALAGLPNEGFDPLPLHTQWITTLRGETPVSRIHRFTAGSQLGIIDDLPAFSIDLKEGRLGSYAPLARMDAALDAGKTSVFQLYELIDETHLTSAQEQVRKAEIQIHYDTDPERRLQVALAVEDWLDPEPMDSAGDPDEEGLDLIDAERDAKTRRIALLQREVVLLNEDTSNALWPVAIFFPSPFEGSPAEALLAVIELAPGENEAGSDIVTSPAAFSWLIEAERLEETPTMALDAGSEDLDSASFEDPALYGVLKVLEELPFSSKKRKALVYLASQTKAGLTLDLCLTAPDSVVIALADRLDSMADAKRPKDLDALGWKIESSAYALLAEQLAGPGIGWGLEALLTRHTGEVGRDAASLAEALRGVGGSEAFQSRLMYENLLFLEDSSPAARCRAFDWLEKKGQAPEGYDPLDSLKARRAALEGAFEEKDKEHSGETAK